MATEKRLIDINPVIYDFRSITIEARYKFRNNPAMNEVIDLFDMFVDHLRKQPIVDAVPVDDIILHHILIDQNGIPEVTIQLGDRTLILRREGDPVDVREVVRCKDCRGTMSGITHPSGRCLCERISRWVSDNDFCSNGEKR